MVARLDGNTPVEIDAAAIGDRYIQPNTTGTFTYSGNNVAYVARAGEPFQRFKGDSTMTLDFGNGTGRLDSTAKTVPDSRQEAVAVLDAPLNFDPTDGKFTSNGGTMRYTDDDGTLTGEWGVAGGVNGRNAGFSATHSSEDAAALIGRGVMAGSEVRPAP